MAQTSYSDAPAVAFAGMLGDSDNHYVRSGVSEESSAEIRFGAGVKRGTFDGGVLLPTAQASKVIGVAVHSHAYAPGYDLGDVGIMPNTEVSVLRRGTVWVYVEEAVTEGDRGFCRAVIAGAELQGVWRKSADSTDCVDCTKQTEFLTSAGAGGLALLQVDFINEPD